MSEQLLTAGEFAKLARTTKRTVLWYDKMGILKPAKIDKSGYRHYKLDQILDYQSVSLMRKLGFSIAEITSLLAQDKSMAHLFEQQRAVLERQIGQLRHMLADTNRYYQNLQANGTLVQPELVQVPAFGMYYIERRGPYSQIRNYHTELYNCFAELPDTAVRFTAFMASRYQPARARMKIGVVWGPGMVLKPGTDVQQETVSSFQSLRYVHRGSTTLLSLLWQELGKYRRSNHLELDGTLPFADIEFYPPEPTGYPDDDSITTEIHMPVLVRSE